MTEVGQGEHSASDTQREEQVGQAAGRLEEGETRRRHEGRISRGTPSKKDNNKVVVNLRVVLHRPLFIFIQLLCLLGGRGKREEIMGCVSQDHVYCSEMDEKQRRGRSDTHVEFGASPPKLDAEDFEDLPHLRDDSNHTSLPATELTLYGASAEGTS